MADDSKAPTPFSLKRWSQRKLAAARAAEAGPALPPAAPEAPMSSPVAAIPGAAPAAAAETPLPPVESLTFDSDFAAFMQPKIDETTKRAALKKLFSDPSFNVMDGLDIYVGDYTQPDPMPAGMLEKLSAVYRMLDPAEPPPDEEVAKSELPPVADTPPVAGPAAPAQVGTQPPPVADHVAPEVADPSDADKTVKPAEAA
jgi:hypothetical protein